jgi:hypothetical protein
MPSPNIFYSYTQSYPPSIHESQLWKYNNCNSFPKVGTSVYTSAKNRKTSCLIPSPNYGLRLVAALLTTPASHDISGFSSGAGLPAAPYPAAGSLTPSSIYGTRILGVWTLDLPPGGVPPLQLHIGISGVIPTSITFTGGDLAKSYTVSTADPHFIPSGNPAIWVWLNNGFYLTPGVTYTVFINK